MTTIGQKRGKNKDGGISESLKMQIHLLFPQTTMPTIRAKLLFQDNGQVHGMDHIDMEVGVLKD